MLRGANMVTPVQYEVPFIVMADLLSELYRRNTTKICQATGIMRTCRRADSQWKIVVKRGHSAITMW